MSGDFNWNETETVIPEQAQTAVYRNPEGAIVIRQRGETFDDDSFVVIQPANLDILLDKLGELLGNLSDKERGR